MKRRVVLGLAAALAMTVALPPAWAQETVQIANISELSGPGATSGVNWRDGAKMAIEEINASGGILGSQVELAEYDSQSDAQTSRAMVQKAIDEGAFALLGTVYSGSTIVNMLVAQQAGIPQFTGSESARITAMGNPYIFRTSFGSQKSMPKIADYMEKEMGVKKVAVVWANTEFGKAGYDAFVAEMEARGIEIVADVPTENAQADFAADVVNVKNSDAEAIFVYLTEEESARFLREARKQGVSQPLVGETTLIGQKVIDLAGDAANGAMGHVGLTPDAPNPQVQEMAVEVRGGVRLSPRSQRDQGLYRRLRDQVRHRAGGRVRQREDRRAPPRPEAARLRASRHPDRRELGRHRGTLARELPGQGRGRQAGRHGDAAGQLRPPTPARRLGGPPPLTHRPRPEPRRRRSFSIGGSMTEFIQIILSGLATGSIYALAAIGFTLLWQASQTINFAQGEFVMLPAFFALIGMHWLGMPFVPSLAFAMLASLLVLGLAFKKLVIEPMLPHGTLPIVMATIALGLLLKESVKVFYSAEAQPFPSLFSDAPINIMGAVISAPGHRQPRHLAPGRSPRCSCS